MKKYLQSTLIFQLLFICSTLYGQKERIKTVKVEQINTVQEIIQKNIPENKNTVIPEQTTKSNTMQIRIPDSTGFKISTDSKVDENITSGFYIHDVERIAIPDNVIYEKETLPENIKVSSAEKKRVKVAASVNYKEREIKEDVHPVTEYSSTKIALNKRIYLQQEANDLQIEILQNANNNGYDLVKKQKQLEEIKLMLKN